MAETQRYPHRPVYLMTIVFLDVTLDLTNAAAVREKTQFASHRRIERIITCSYFDYCLVISSPFLGNDVVKRELRLKSLTLKDG